MFNRLLVALADLVVAAEAWNPKRDDKTRPPYCNTVYIIYHEGPPTSTPHTWILVTGMWDGDKQSYGARWRPDLFIRPVR